MAKPNSTVLRDLFTVALSIHRDYPDAPSDSPGYVTMQVTEASSLRAAIAQCRQFVSRHEADAGAFPGGDVWFDGELLVFSIGDGDGADERLWMVAAGQTKRLLPRASGNYRFIEESCEWRLITRGSINAAAA